ncbi:sensor histidine kinase [Hydrogenophaga sp. SL48]|jgi:PAS domain S-box-containing protein|uniref:sensor histidine kinase n=1 Tax=Hydrogenophaga sp. SL48 TaxID=2806347 RepID=UPI001F3E68D4|nr:histidine kinase dimerization/phosphoacceptor domain -containing protein [Hydrogenophaga sp. SL48]UJW81834.1 PAS domain S-box protein [Hydrogenophaga sp. SL48]
MTQQHIRLDEYLGQAFDRIPVAMVVVNLQGTITRLNRLAETTFGYLSEELLGRPVEVLVPERYRHAHPGYRKGFQAEATARPMGAGRDLSGLRKDGSEFPVEIGINPVETGEGPMILSVILDLSERKQSERRIHEALREKELLLEEVHHRVKNNMQVIHSLLDLQVLKISDPDLVTMLRDSQNRIRSMSMIHQTLYQSHDFAQVDFQQFLGELLPTLMDSYGMVSGHVAMEVSANNVKLPINEAIPCGLIVNELVSNALKHGFRGHRRGAIRVGLQQETNGDVELSISNDGIEIPPDQNLERNGSLGLQLVQLLTRQLQGTLEIQRANPTCFTLRFSLGRHA